jgi:CRISPR-associated protein Cmr4
MPRGRLIWIRAESYVHVGVGQQASVVDLPFAREGATGYPYLPGSGLKGGLRDAYWLGKDPASSKATVTDSLFGKSDEAGKILFSDARLAFLPVRTLGGTYRYVTSVGLLRRLRRDMDFVGETWTVPGADVTIGDDEVGVPTPTTSGKVFLEEFPFTTKGPIQGTGLTELGAARAEVDGRIAILNDAAFDYFARYGLFVRQRNALDAMTKTVKGTALWSEESLPPDTLMYFVLMPRLPDQMADVDGDLLPVLRDSCRGYFQAGGNETVGEGWFKMLNLPELRAADAPILPPAA